MIFMICGVQVASALMTEPDVHTFLNMDSHGIWTATPVRIDQRAQTFERLPAPPDPFPLKLRSSPQRKALDNARFTQDGRLFRLAGITPIDRKMVCADNDGRKTACGLAAFKSLDNTLRGRSMECRIEGEQAQETLVQCRIGGQDLSASLQAVSTPAR